MGKKWTAVDLNLSKALEGKMTSKRITVPKSIQLKIVLDLDDALFKVLSKDPSWLQKLQQEAKGHADSCVAEMAKYVDAVDKKTTGLRVITSPAFVKDLTQALEKRVDAAGKAMGASAVKLVDDYKKGKKELTKFRVKSAVKITISSVGIAASVAGAAATYGALSPLSIVGIARAGVTIVQECAKLASTCDVVAKLVQGELKILKKVMSEDLEKATKAGKVAQGAKEVGLNVLSKALGVESPSLKNCDSHIGLHKVNISKLEKQSKKLSTKIYGAMDEQEKWAKEWSKAKKSLPAKQVGKVESQLARCEKALDVLLKATIKVNQSVAKASQQQELFAKTLDAMQKGLPKWIKYVDVAVGLALDVGMGVADASSAAEKALAAITTVESTIASELTDMA